MREFLQNSSFFWFKGRFIREIGLYVRYTVRISFSARISVERLNATFHGQLNLLFFTLHVLSVS